MCSYNSPTFIFQPIELLCLASIFRDSVGGEPILIDAIAEGLSQSEVIEKIENIQPDFIISLTGFECIEEDIRCVAELKRKFKNIKVILFGHYATEFPHEVLEHSDADIVIHGEPDLIFKDLITTLDKNLTFENIHGVSYRNSLGVIHQNGSKRIPNPNELPMPAFDLLKNHYYSEPFFPKPYGLIQSARGCPYQCNYCVKSYGTKLTMLSPENIILQLEKYIELFDIKSFRFIDDTFTAVPGRVIEFCKLMIDNGYDSIIWSCLSRPDTLNPEMLKWMKKAGCRRIYIGMESGSQEVLDFYNKNIDVKVSMDAIKNAKRLGFEIMGFFMVGAPNESNENVMQSVKFANNAGFDFVAISKLIVYPGTSLFDKINNKVDFKLYPYKNEFVMEGHETKAYKQQKLFYRKFYFNPKRILFIFFKYSKAYFLNVVENIYSFFSYLISSSTNRTRKDYI